MAKSTLPSTSTSKAKAMSLHIGLNAVSPAAYGGWSGELGACEFDAKDVAAIAKSRGMKSTLLLTKKGTRANALAAMRKAAKQLGNGDLFFLTYSGHGGQAPDVTGEELDKKDETWRLFDGQLIDDELYFELGRFASGVRILVLSDSCHSGTVTRAATPQPDGAWSTGRSKMMPLAVGIRAYRKHQTFYDKLQRDVAEAAGKTAATDPDSALAQLAVSPRLTAIATQFKPAVILISVARTTRPPWTAIRTEHSPSNC